MKQLLLLITLVLVSKTITAQTPSQQRRDWVVGHYVGMQKDSTNHTPWVAATLDIIYTSNQPCCPGNGDDSTVSVAVSNHIVGMDSTFLFPWGGVDANNTGKLYADSTLLYHFFEAGPISQGGGEYYFIGKLTQSYVGINKFTNNEQINIYPNPANTSMQIKVSNAQTAEIKILDVLGKEVLSTKEKDIDVSALQEGIYFVQVKTAEGVLIKKVVVQR